MATAIATVVIGATAAALRSALGPVEIRRVRVRLARLPRAQHGLTIVQITDLHVGPTIGRAVVEDVVNRTNALSPDIVAITGDLVDGSVSALRDAVAPLANLRARHGVFFVTGNHEYFSGADEWVKELPRLGIRVLGNERVSIGEGVASFNLGGIEDRSAHRYGGLTTEAALARALEGRDPKRELVLLAHQPRSLLDAAPFELDCRFRDTPTVGRSGRSGSSFACSSGSGRGCTATATRRSMSAAAPVTGARQCAWRSRRRSRT